MLVFDGALTLRGGFGIIGAPSARPPPARKSRVSSTGPVARLLAFVLRRILQSFAVMAVVAFIAFGLFNFTGDPVTFMVSQQATLEERAELRAALGLDRPYYVQFARFVGNAAHGEFGVSLRQGRAVAQLLKERLPATIELSLAAALIALVIGIPLGVYTARRRDTWLSHLL